jgi:hypothetical protein
VQPVFFTLDEKNDTPEKCKAMKDSLKSNRIHKVPIPRNPLFMTSHAGKSPPVTRGDYLGSTCGPLAVASQKLPRFWGCSEPSPILPALKSSTFGCPFEVGPVGLAATKTHMVVGAPRSYLNSELRPWHLYHVPHPEWATPVVVFKPAYLSTARQEIRPL